MRLMFFLLILFVAAVTAFSQQKMSDRQMEGFKGKVQRVLEEESEFVFENGKYSETEKVPSDEMNFDVDGSFLRRVLYSDGKIFIDRKYDFLDGERITIEKTFYNEDGLITAPSRAGQESAVRDSRYSFKFKYKFDNKGRRIEEEWYSNTGKLWIRDVRNYDDKGNEIEWFRYSSDGKLNMRSISEFDDKGNEIKKTYPGVISPDIVEGYIYEYTFDSQGNWLIRISKKLSVKNGKTEYLPYQVNYRKIIYFNQN